MFYLRVRQVKEAVSEEGSRFKTATVSFGLVSVKGSRNARALQGHSGQRYNHIWVRWSGVHILMGVQSILHFFGK